MIRCVVFDFDGTLVQSVTIKRDAFDRVVEGIAGGPALIEKLLGDGVRRDRHGTFQAFVERQRVAGVECPEAAALVEYYSVICDREIARCDEVTGATELLGELGSIGVAVHLMSGTPHDALVRAVVLRGMENRFRSVTGGPTAKIDVLAAIAQSGDLVAGNMLVVGDGEDDRAAAEKFGASFVRVVSPQGQDLSGDRAVSKLTDIPRLPGLEFAGV